MVSKILITLCVVAAITSAIPAGAGWGANPWAAGGGGNPWAGGGGGNPWAGGGGSPWAGAGANPFIPPWIATAPWFPQWVPCTTIGASCVDCTTRQICTKIGGLQRACTDPTLPYCNLGECSATPSAECQPPTAPAEIA